MQGVGGQFLGRELRSHLPPGQKKKKKKIKTQNRSNIETNSITTLKVVQIKKIFFNHIKKKI